MCLTRQQLQSCNLGRRAVMFARLAPKIGIQNDECFVDVILFYHHDNLNTEHCFSLTLRCACSQETLSACLRNYMTTVGCIVWIQTESRPTPYFGSRGKAVVKRQHHLLPHPFQLIIPSHPISRLLQSETLTQSFHKLRRQIKLSGQTQALTALLPVKETFSY